MIMKTPFFLLTLILLSSFNGNAQEEFSFQLYFEDAAGNRDTLILGYDDNATTYIDVAFGEENIIAQPWDSIFDTRITDEYWNRVFYSPSGPGTFHTKKQIITFDAPSVYINFVIDMKVVHWPITLSWDSFVFNETNFTNGSFITSAQYGVWGDWGVPVHYVSQENTYQVYPDTSDGAVSYYTVDNNNIYSLWFVFANGFVSVHSLTNLPDIDVSPNPFSDNFTIDSDVPVSEVHLVDAMGKQIDFEQNANSITPVNCSAGIYFLSVLFENGQSSRYKLIKQ
jgi:hypothetical protein